MTDIETYPLWGKDPHLRNAHVSKDMVAKKCHQILIQLSVYMIPNDSSHTIFNSTTFNFMMSQNMHWKTNWSLLHVK